MNKSAYRIKYDEPEWASTEIDRLLEELGEEDISPAKFEKYLKKHGSRALRKEFRKAQKLLLG